MAPDLEFRGQPFLPDDTAGEFIARSLADESMSQFRMAVAWARFGGVARIEPHVAALRERGGTAGAVVGIDEGVATKPGMRKLLNVFDRVHVVHDPGGRTFHPKLYLVEGPARATLLVGSSNATAGGLYFNFEASLEAIFELSHAPHREAGQGNVPTVLHWGPQLNALLRATDYSGHIVRIERLDDGSYRLNRALKALPRRRPADPAPRVSAWRGESGRIC